MCEAIARAKRGLIDADLGGGIIKQRIARPNEGKSGGFRSIILFQTERCAFFVYGFPKSGRDNIREDELKAFKLLAGVLLAYNDQQLQTALDKGVLIPVICNEQNNENV